MRTTIFLILILLFPILMFQSGLKFLYSLLDSINARIKEDASMTTYHAKRCVALFIIFFFLCVIGTFLLPILISLILSIGSSLF